MLRLRLVTSQGFVPIPAPPEPTRPAGLGRRAVTWGPTPPFLGRPPSGCGTGRWLLFYAEAEIKPGRGAGAAPLTPGRAMPGWGARARPAQTALDSTPTERSLSSMDVRRFGGPCRRRRPARPRLRGGMPPPQRLLGRDRLCSVGSCRSQADEARRHAGSRASGNGPDAAERAPLDARGMGAVRVPGSTRESGRAMHRRRPE